MTRNGTKELGLRNRLLVFIVSIAGGVAGLSPFAGILLFYLGMHAYGVVCFLFFIFFLLIVHHLNNRNEEDLVNTKAKNRQEKSSLNNSSKEKPVVRSQSTKKKSSSLNSSRNNETRKISTLNTDFEVAGSKYNNIDGVPRQDLIAGLTSGHQLRLRRETENTHDSFAIVVQTDFGTIGYVPKKLARKLNFFNLRKVKVKLIALKRNSDDTFAVEVNVSAHESNLLIKELTVDSLFYHSKKHTKLYSNPIFFKLFGDHLERLYCADDGLWLKHRHFGFVEVNRVFGTNSDTVVCFSHKSVSYSYPISLIQTEILSNTERAVCLKSSAKKKYFNYVPSIFERLESKTNRGQGPFCGKCGGYHSKDGACPNSFLRSDDEWDYEDPIEFERHYIGEERHDDEREWNELI